MFYSTFDFRMSLYFLTLKGMETTCILFLVMQHFYFSPPEIKGLFVL